MYQKLFLTIVFMAFLLQTQAQNTTYVTGKSVFELSKTNNIPVLLLTHNNSASTKTKQTKTITAMPLYYCYDKLAFFCKVEVKLEKRLSYPLKFRLGSVDHVDYLEGKKRNED